ncbi:Uncharacterised protein [Candidatus Bartonella washoeensis]|nr:Uncharacterised protein [Bartonella washoeensis]
MRAGDFVQRVLQMYGGQQPYRASSAVGGSVPQGFNSNRDNLLAFLRALLSSQQKTSEADESDDDNPLMTQFMRAFYGPFYKI